MADLTDYAESQLAKWAFTNESITRPTAWYMALFTSAPSDAGGGTEASGGGYARGAVTFDETVGVLTNNAVIQMVATGGDFGNIVAVGIFDALTSGNLWAWKAVPTQTVNDGQEAKFTAGAVVVRFD